MKPFNLAELVCLGVIWGVSFLFMRISVPEFGPVALMLVRSAVAALFLLPIALISKQFHEVFIHWKPILFVAMINTVLPFTLLGYATLHLNAGIASILNAMVPIFAPIVAFLWFRQQLSLLAMIGIFSGFIGVALIAGIKDDSVSEFRLLPVLAGMTASIFYAVGANFTGRYLIQLKSITIATGSQLFATVLLLPVGLYFWPSQPISGLAWGSVIVLGVLCTAIAFIIFFHLLSQVGSTLAVLVTYLVPLFAIVFGYIFLDESIRLQTFIGGGFIVIGITLVTGIYRRLPLFKRKANL